MLSGIEIFNCFVSDHLKRQSNCMNVSPYGEKYLSRNSCRVLADLQKIHELTWSIGKIMSEKLHKTKFSMKS